MSEPASRILTLEGELDLHRSSEIKDAFRPLIERKVPRILADMTGVTYIDSAGLAAFIETFRGVASYGGRFGFFGLRDNVRSIFEIAHLDQVFEIFPDQVTAEAAG